MSRPSKSTVLALIVIGASVVSGFVFFSPESAGNAPWLGATFSAAAVAALYIFNRNAWHRAAGWYGSSEMRYQWGSNRSDPSVIGKWSAVGGTLGTPVIGILAIYLGVKESQIMGFLGAALGSLFMSAGILWAILLANPRAQLSMIETHNKAND
jgi:hypothetical protein